ncbi:MAG: BrxA/BrxB family bacilliredoxin [Cryomorphaceae bacterium]|nr:BrxA/BrxB family bacilliredoxin [Cryomorphaceae bacterium]
MYPEDMIAPMRADLTNAGFTEVRTAQDMENVVKAEGTTLVVINSVCGCAAANARPAAKLAVQHSKRPDRVITSFAGNDKDAVNKARELMAPFPPSSPSMALFKNGQLVHMIERHHIEGRLAELIADNLKQAFDEHC